MTNGYPNVKKKGVLPLMTIKELRLATDMNQTSFARYFEIPVRTVQDWEGERRTPPEYLVKLMQYKLKKENIIK